MSASSPLTAITFESDTSETENGCSFYRLAPISAESKVQCFVASTPESRRICNDPFVFGVEYTSGLRKACAAALRAFQQTEHCALEESETVILHILRGGLNFGLREAAYDAFGWNEHVSAFISAQRRRLKEGSEDWEVVEREYRKVYLPTQASIVSGDVVATGTSLGYALDQIRGVVESGTQKLRSLLFFTIGAGPTEHFLSSFDSWARERFPAYQGTSVIYLEGRFGVATPETPLRIKFTGTDLIRHDADMAPEFIDSQAHDPCFPIERCTIYDAGSRAFWLPEYKEDVREYWEQVHALAKSGISYADYLLERYPQAPKSLPRDFSLVSLAEQQLAKLQEKNSH